MVENLVKDEKKLNETTDYLFKLLEQRSLFGASEYLALKVLNEVSCTIDADLASQLESYRAMKIGNTASEMRTMRLSETMPEVFPLSASAIIRNGKALL